MAFYNTVDRLSHVKAAEKQPSQVKLGTLGKAQQLI